MKRIEFKIVHQNDASGRVSEAYETVTARDINSGFRKITSIALRRRWAGPGWTIVSITLWEVKS